MVEFGWQLLFLGVLIGGMYSSYKIGHKEGSGAMIDFCKSKSNKQGLTLIHFFGKNIEFLDPLTYNQLMLNKIVDAIEEQNDESSS